MSNKIVCEYDTQNISIRDAMIKSINSTFDKYGSVWFEKSELNGNIIEIIVHDQGEDFSIIVQNKKGSGVI